MVLSSALALVEAIRQYQLLEPDQLEVLTADLQVRFAEPRSLARELVQRDWLTPYQVNQIFAGRAADLQLGSYVLLERLGEGGMGAVFKARHCTLGRVVALKLIRPERVANKGAIRRFHREIRAAAQLNHPHIVLAFDANEVAGKHFFTMEYVEGTDLARLVRKEGPLPVAVACDCIRQAALGLEHAFERGLVHRDIKPANLLRTTQGVVKVLDMGLARLASSGGERSSGTLTEEGTVMGTPDFIAPEQAREAHDVDIRADLYSLGCSLYFLLTGQVPFPKGALAAKLLQHQLDEPPAVEQLRPEVPLEVAAVVRKLMAKKPGDRYPTPAEVAAVLAIPASGERPSAAGPKIRGSDAPRAPQSGLSSIVNAPDTAEAIDSRRQIRQRAERRRWLILNSAGGALLLVLLGVLGFLLTRTGSSRTATALTAQPSATGPNGEPPPGALSLGGEPGAEVRKFTGHTGPVNYVAFFPDGRRAISATHREGKDFTVRIWDLQTGQGLRKLQQPDSLLCVALSPDGRRALFGYHDGTMALWDIDEDMEVGRFFGHEGWVDAVAFSPDGRKALAGSTAAPYLVRLWDLQTGKEQLQFKGHTGSLTRVVFSPDGLRALSGSVDRTMRLWDLTTGEELKRFEENQLNVNTVGFSPDGGLAWSASGDGRVRLWDVSTGTKRWEKGGVRLAFSPDGRRFVITGGSDGRIFLHDRDNLAELHPFTGHTARVTALAISPDGHHVLSGSADQTLRLWRLPDPPGPGAWQPLFNGKDLTGWTRSNATDMGRAEVVLDDGQPALRMTPPIALHGPVLGNHYLRYEFKAEKNTGAISHILDNDKYLTFTHAGTFGPGRSSVTWSFQQAKIQDGRLVPFGPPTGTGFKFGGVAAEAGTSWQCVEVVQLDDSLIYFVNGKLAGAVTDIRLDGQRATGQARIYLRAFDTAILFRNIAVQEIRALPPEVLKKASWRFLFNGKDLAGWERWIDPSNAGEPLPAVADVDGAAAIRICSPGDKIVAGITSAEDFSNYHLRLEYRWPAGAANAQAAVRYHHQDYAFFQFLLATPDSKPPGLNGRLHSSRERFVDEGVVQAGGTIQIGAANQQRLTAWKDPQKPVNQWNLLELYCVGGTVVQVLNGDVVCVGANCRHQAGEQSIPVVHGRLRLLCTQGEIFFRRVEVRPISVLPPQLLGRGGG